MKICNDCKEIEFVDSFCKDKNKKDGLNSICKDCSKKRFEKYQQTENGKKIIKAHNLSPRKRDWYLKTKYNITLEQYDEMFEKQNGNCAICGLPELMKRLSVDHDHETGEVRGLLCQSCNGLLGLAKDNQEILFDSINYLDKYCKEKNFENSK